MADLLDQLNDLNTAYNWLGGAKKVKDSTKLVQATAKEIDKIAKDAKKSKSGLTFDKRQLEKLLSSGLKELTRLNGHWTAQETALNKAAKAPWPAIRNDAADRYDKLLAIEKSEGADSPAFEKALKDTVKYLEGYKEKVAERASYCRMVAKKMAEMQDAYMEGNDAIDDTYTLLTVALGTGILAHSGGAAASAMRHIVNIERTIKNRPKFVAQAYRALADSALAEDGAQTKELARIDKALKTLYRMQGQKVLEDVKDYLSGLFKRT